MASSPATSTPTATLGAGPSASMLGQLASWGTSVISYAQQQITSVLSWERLEVVDPDADTASKGDNRPEGLFAEERKAAWSSSDYSQYIGLDVSNLMQVPMWIHEPVGVLQKMAELMEYATLLDEADRTDDPHDRMALVAAFLVSPYGCAERAWKPFNPVLGETFEMEGEVMPGGGRYLAEQVSEQPPVAAAHAETDHWEYDLVSAPTTRFLGNSLEVFPNGRTRIRLKHSGELFTHTPPNAKVHNLVIGRTWIDAFGTFTVTNATTGARVLLEFAPCGWFGAGRYSFRGHVINAAGEKVLLLTGLWNSHCDVVACGADGSAAPGAQPRRLWSCSPKPAGDYYGFTSYTHRLCGVDGLAAPPLPSDSRRRADVSALYAGDSSAAAAALSRVQKAADADKRAAASGGTAPQPRWFVVAPDMEVLEGEAGAATVPLWRWKGEYFGQRSALVAGSQGGACTAADVLGKDFNPWFAAGAAE